uniref:Uncharacterized protein n=1 Tax=Calcidiscus leptoporus TaxID=127549 RepID=A0A7S0JAV9_9EUKA|mmetsp:Transcript_48096/g.111403  ORF Transcript_48096/g.111403 Transcript_48096/m.111403 type:complete len:221 (+) Transcript_48096:395-1057(+)
MHSPKLSGMMLPVEHINTMQMGEDRSLPPTPRSPSPTCSPPSSPKRQKVELSPAEAAAAVAADDDLESRAAALGICEATRSWDETFLPPTPSSPSPTFSPPSSPKRGQRSTAELLAAQKAANAQLLAARAAAAVRTACSSSNACSSSLSSNDDEDDAETIASAVAMTSVASGMEAMVGVMHGEPMSDVTVAGAPRVESISNSQCSRLYTSSRGRRRERED